MKKKLGGKTIIKNPIQGTKYTIAISSAKGGVGKSTFATNIAIALKKTGCKVGLLDADIYGPSLPKLFSINEKPKSDGKTLNPISKYGIQCMSIGFLTEEQTPMIWRGPMVTSAIKTFTQKVAWKDLDFIIIDMPPGTGDTQLTFSQEIKMDGVIIISTPQEIALQDVKRGIRMFDKLKVKIIGLIDNMSHFVGDDKKKYPIYGEGVVKRTSEEFKKEFKFIDGNLFEKSINNKKVFIIDRQNYFQVCSIVCKCKIFVGCHGSLTHFIHQGPVTLARRRGRGYAICSRSNEPKPDPSNKALWLYTI